MSKPRAFGFSNPIEDVEEREKAAKEGTLKEEITPEETQKILDQLGPGVFTFLTEEEDDE